MIEKKENFDRETTAGHSILSVDLSFLNRSSRPVDGHHVHSPKGAMIGVLLPDEHHLLDHSGFPHIHDVQVHP